MAQLVRMGGMLQCSFGVAPSTLVVLRVNKTLTRSMQAANIMPLGVCNSVVCNSVANPMVIAAAAAGLGVLTLNSISKLICNWGGLIQINMAGQFTTMVP